MMAATSIKPDMDTISLKIKYADTVRKVLLPPQPPPAWSRLAYALKERFQLSPDQSIGLRYSDPEADYITISSQVELDELWDEIRAGAKLKEKEGITRKVIRLDLVIISPALSAVTSATVSRLSSLSTEPHTLEASLTESIRSPPHKALEHVVSFDVTYGESVFTFDFPRCLMTSLDLQSLLMMARNTFNVCSRTDLTLHHESDGRLSELASLEDLEILWSDTRNSSINKAAGELRTVICLSLIDPSAPPVFSLGAPECQVEPNEFVWIPGTTTASDEMSLIGSNVSESPRRSAEKEAPLRCTTDELDPFDIHSPPDLDDNRGPNYKPVAAPVASYIDEVSEEGSDNVDKEISQESAPDPPEQVAGDDSDPKIEPLPTDTASSQAHPLSPLVTLAMSQLSSNDLTRTIGTYAQLFAEVTGQLSSICHELAVHVNTSTSSSSLERPAPYNSSSPAVSAVPIDPSLSSPPGGFPIQQTLHERGVPGDSLVTDAIRSTSSRVEALRRTLCAKQTIIPSNPIPIVSHASGNEIPTHTNQTFASRSSEFDIRGMSQLHVSDQQHNTGASLTPAFHQLPGGQDACSPPLPNDRSEYLDHLRGFPHGARAYDHHHHRDHHHDRHHTPRHWHAHGPRPRSQHHSGFDYTPQDPFRFGHGIDGHHNFHSRVPRHSHGWFPPVHGRSSEWMSNNNSLGSRPEDSQLHHLPPDHQYPSLATQVDKHPAKASEDVQGSLLHLRTAAEEAKAEACNFSTSLSPSGNHLGPPEQRESNRNTSLWDQASLPKFLHAHQTTAPWGQATWHTQFEPTPMASMQTSFIGSKEMPNVTRTPDGAEEALEGMTAISDGEADSFEPYKCTARMSFATRLTDEEKHDTKEEGYNRCSTAQEAGKENSKPTAVEWGSSKGPMRNRMGLSDRFKYQSSGWGAERDDGWGASPPKQSSSSKAWLLDQQSQARDEDDGWGTCWTKESKRNKSGMQMYKKRGKGKGVQNTMLG